jgi:hypothetical protein
MNMRAVGTWFWRLAMYSASPLGIHGFLEGGDIGAVYSGVDIEGLGLEPDRLACELLIGHGVGTEAVGLFDE